MSFSGTLSFSLVSLLGRPSNKSLDAKKSELWNGSLLVLLDFVAVLNGSPEKKSSEESY